MTQNGVFFIALIAAIIALVAALRWFIVNRLPAADWSFSFNADAHGQDVTADEAFAAQRAGARRLLDAELYEKIALVALVTVIFSRILPNTDVSPFSLAVGVAAVIVANTVVSELLVRRGVRWQSTLLEFVVMAVINALMVAAFFLILPFAGGALDLPATLFFLLLLTLLVTLYDRFRPYEQVRAFRAEESQQMRAAQA